MSTVCRGFRPNRFYQQDLLVHSPSFSSTCPHQLAGRVLGSSFAGAVPADIATVDLSWIVGTKMPSSLCGRFVSHRGYEDVGYVTTIFMRINLYLDL